MTSHDNSGSNVTFVATSSDFQVEPPNLEPDGRATRLQLAVRNAGGRAAVAARARIPLSTLGDYLAGGEMKVSTLLTLAEACGVRLEWLAIGRHPMRDEPVSPSPPAPPPLKTSATAARSSETGVAQALFSWADVEQLGASVLAAIGVFRRAGRALEPRALGQAVALLYDAASDQSQESSQSVPEQEKQP